LIKKGADINVLNDKGQTPLHLATATGQVSLVSTIVKSGQIDINAQDGSSFFYYSNSSKRKAFKIKLFYPSS